MLPKAHLTSYSRIYGSRCVITAPWLYGSLRPFLYSLPMYSCHLSLITSPSVRFILLLSLLCTSLHEMFGICLASVIFLKRSLVFPILFFSSTCLHYSLKETFLFPLAILQNPAFRWVYLSFSPLLFTFLLFSAVCKTSSDNSFTFLHYFFWRMVLITAFFTMLKPLSIVLQALCLSDLTLWIYLSLSLYNHKGFDLGHTCMSHWFFLHCLIEIWILQ